MRYFILICLTTLAISQTAKKNKILGTVDQKDLNDFTLRESILQQEERAIQAERLVLEMNKDNIRDANCRSVEVSNCTLNFDRNTWYISYEPLVINPPTSNK